MACASRCKGRLRASGPDGQPGELLRRVRRAPNPRRGRLAAESDDVGWPIDATQQSLVEHLIAAGASDLFQGLYESRDGARSWNTIGDAVGLLSWPTPERLFLVDGNGNVSLSTNGGARFERRGAIGGQAAALLGQGPEELYAALHDGTIKRSTDGGSTWTVRSTP